MNVSGVSGGSNAVQPTFQDNTFKIIKQLEAQKIKLQDQVKEVSDSKLDEKVKQDRIKELQDQIQQIDASISQIRTEQINRNLNKQNENTSKDNEREDADASAGGLQDLINAGASYSHIKMMHGIKNNLKNAATILKTEIKEDEGRSPSGARASTKRMEVAQIESRERSIDEKAGQEIQGVHKHVGNISKKEKDKVEKEEKDNKENKDSKEETDKKKRIDVLI